MANQLTSMLRIGTPVLIVITLFLSFGAVAAGFGISMGIDGNLDGAVGITEQYLEPDGPQRFTVEAKNPGAMSFTGRIRLDVRNAENQTVFRAWSDTIQVTPGSLAAHTFLFHDPNRNETLTAEAVLHHGVNRVSETVTFNTTPHDTMDGFDVLRHRTGEETVTMTVDAPEDVDTFFVTLKDRSTRRFVQTRVQNAAGRQVVTVPYYPEVRVETDATITLSSVDGRYHYTEDVMLTRDEPGILDRTLRWLGDVSKYLVFI